MQTVLIVEDEQAIANLIYVNLKEEGYRCTCAYDGKTAADLIENQSYDLILLDIMLPEVDGYELLEYIKPTGTPVIFITAKGAVADRIKGLKLGADDYLVKPFQIGELIARVEAVMRRYGKSDKQLVFKDVSINLDSRQVIKNGRTIDLTVKEFDLLVELIRNKNVALYRDRLYEKVWQDDFIGETRTLDSHIQRLRKKLGWEDCIKTVFRIGYRLEG
ncbi:MAG: response regulator transcription factor [Defluviitaleaceae bacterium]|nr:response regulator transcription factor [Defluviitaleaceae bacterium]